jgi:TRAP-type C4-dicarboxylate transport system substrate-binding protein
MRSLFSPTFLSIVFIALLSSANTSLAATFKIATLSPDGSAWMVKMRAAGKDIEAQTNGRVKFKFYPGGVMGSDSAVIRKMKIGQLHGGALTGGALAKAAPDTQIYNLPFMFKSFAEVDYVRERMDDKIIQSFADAGYTVFGLAEGGFAYMLANRSITDFDTLKQGKIWAPDNDILVQRSMESFELGTIPLALGDVLPSLQTGMVDTVATSPIGAIALQWHTQVTHITDMPLLYFYGILALNNKAYKKVSDDDKVIVSHVMNSAFKAIDKINRQDNIDAFEALQALGIQRVEMNPADKTMMQGQADALAQTMLNNKQFSQPIFDEIQTLLTEFRGAAE